MYPSARDMDTRTPWAPRQSLPKTLSSDYRDFPWGRSRPENAHNHGRGRPRDWARRPSAFETDPSKISTGGRRTWTVRKDSEKTKMFNIKSQSNMIFWEDIKLWDSVTYMHDRLWTYIASTYEQHIKHFTYHYEQMVNIWRIMVKTSANISQHYANLGNNWPTMSFQKCLVC